MHKKNSSESLLFRIATVSKKDTSAQIFQNEVFIYNYLYVLFVAQPCKCLLMHVGISKRKKWKKNIARSTKAAKKVQVFSFKTFFSGKPFLVYKKSLFFRVYFYRCHWRNFRRIFRFSCNSEQCRSFRRSRFQTTYHGNNLFLSEFLNARYTTSKLMSYKGNVRITLE